MQRRIFRIGGLPFVAARGGFFETHGTLAALIEEHRPGATTDRGAETDVAPMQEAAPKPGKSASGDTGTLVAVLGAPAPAEPEAPRPNTDAPSAKPRKAKAPLPKPPPATTDAAPTGEAAPEPSGAEDMLAAVEATQGKAPEVRPVRRRAGQPAPPRWTVAGKMRRGRLK